MPRRCASLAPMFLACLTASLTAATLERLSMEDMVQKSVSIVRGHVSATAAGVRTSASRGGIIYTHYTVQVLERWKGAAAQTVDIAVPGGATGNRRQTFPGAPVLEPNTDYVFFLWTSPSGLTQVIGLSQGVVGIKVDASGTPVLSRNASSEPMADKTGKPVADAAFSMSLNDFRAKMSGYGMAAK